MTQDSNTLFPIIRNEAVRLRATIWGEGVSVWEPDGIQPTVELLENESDNAPYDVREILGSVEVWIRTRRYIVDGRPVLLARSYVPLALAAGTRITQEDTGPGGVYARLAEAGRTPARFQMDLTAATVETVDAQALVEDPAAPVLVAMRTAYDTAGGAVEYSELVYAPRLIHARFEFPA